MLNNHVSSGKSVIISGSDSSKQQKIRFYTDFLTSTDLVRISGLSPVCNTTRILKLCQIEFYPQDCGGTGNRTPGLLGDNPESAPSYPHSGYIITQKR